MRPNVLLCGGPVPICNHAGRWRPIRSSLSLGHRSPLASTACLYRGHVWGNYAVFIAVMSLLRIKRRSLPILSVKPVVESRHEAATETVNYCSGVSSPESGISTALLHPHLVNSHLSCRDFGRIVMRCPNTSRQRNRGQCRK
jgi:hypothetical protein